MNFKDLFVKHDTSRSERDDYKVSSGKKSIIIIAVISLLCAFLIWAAAVYVDSSVHTFANVKIEIRNAEALTDAGYSITISDNTVTFTVRVNSNVADALTQDSIVPYVDFSGVTTVGDIATLPVMFDSNYKFSITDVSVENVEALIYDAISE